MNLCDGQAVLGFVKVLVSRAEAKDIQSILTDLVSAVLPWSSISRNHFRSKVLLVLAESFCLSSYRHIYSSK